jgi:hypothetical protein
MFYLLVAALLGGASFFTRVARRGSNKIARRLYKYSSCTWRCCLWR